MRQRSSVGSEFLENIKNYAITFDYMSRVLNVIYFTFKSTSFSSLFWRRTVLIYQTLISYLLNSILEPSVEGAWFVLPIDFAKSSLKWALINE